LTSRDRSLSSLRNHNSAVSNLKPQVIFVSKSEDNPTTRYRIQPLRRALEKRHIRTLRLNSDGGLQLRFQLLIAAPSADIIIIQRKLFDKFFLTLLSMFCDKIIFDFDDAIFTKSDGRAAPRRMHRFNQTVNLAWQVWAGNHYLANVATQQLSHDKGRASAIPSIKYVPTVIETGKYYQRPKSACFSMLWIGSQSTSKYLYENSDMLEALGKRFNNLKLIIVGDFTFELSHLNVECHRWSEQVELEQAANAHIGIAPMSDDDWSRGKCALKVLQYMAAGLPVVSSNTGANADVVVQGQTGFVADTVEDWLAAIEDLQGDPDKALRMGAAGLKRIQAEFNSDLWVQQQLNWLSDILPTIDQS
jgi:glycosyltransferase involved in cell wall biosynthesis